MADPATRPPVFISGLWRSGSTYVWSRFRADPTTYCYYEPLHHGLARLTAARIPRDTFHKTAAMRHPSLAQPYYAEYRPLLAPLVGVKRYSPTLAYDRWTLHPDEPHRRLGRYIDSLIDYARAQGRQPVLGCVRAAGRLGWLGRHRPEMALIHLDRAPLDIWRSCQEQARQGNFTFFSTWLEVVRRNADHPLMAPVADQLPWRTGWREALRRPKLRHHDMLQGMGPDETYYLIVYMWAAAALHGLTHAHAVIDVNRSAEPGYNVTLAGQLADLTGAVATFDDMRIVSTPAVLEPHGREAIEREALALLRAHAPRGLFDPTIVRGRLEELEAGKAALLSLALGLPQASPASAPGAWSAAARTEL